jgi:hypothetical protein
MRTNDPSCRDIRDRRFGRKGGHVASVIAARSSFADDVRLFAITFAGGFLFMTIFLA